MPDKTGKEKPKSIVLDVQNVKATIKIDMVGGKENGQKRN